MLKYDGCIEFPESNEGKMEKHIFLQSCMNMTLQAIKNEHKDVIVSVLLSDSSSQARRPSESFTACLTLKFLFSKQE